SPNLSGIKDPVVDELIELIINTDTREELITRVRALDRILLHGHYGVPNWYQDQYRVAYWDKFGMPGVTPKYVSMANGAVSAWWFDPRKGTSVAARQEQLEQP
ncbi:MAG TPA: hypothetical protein VFY87_10725, partial [Geminicoccaceae bacterium]|nr:hypothetical protein [Geminicoccaceae bacterium]